VVRVQSVEAGEAASSRSEFWCNRRAAEMHCKHTFQDESSAGVVDLLLLAASVQTPGYIVLSQ
jgi:hypothetical protein